jgi:polar amino acid transport system substrate-binding protein
MKKILSLILASVSLFSLVSMTACTSSSTLDSKVLTIGVDNTYPPMEFTDDSNKTVGFDIDVANEIGKRLNLQVKLVPTAWDGIFQSLKTNKFDCIISSVSISPDRLKEFTFTKPYVNNSQMIIVKPGDNSINKKEDLANKKVGCQINTTANDSANTILKTLKFTLTTYDQIIQPFADMKAGRIDAIIVDEVVGKYYIAQDKANFKAASAKLTNEPIGVCFKNGNTALRDKVQIALDAMFADGTMKTLSMKWFAQDITVNIDANYKQLS